ncbi:hypothetical protein [Pontibacillus chungwhensis]|uniref:hypothetical protein n=1 Tax=Pontibacillus chungwhensis TaxID=265426 RepID=UPI000A3E35AC|nr:hypothetical protein [Pontibacillus chungwhensis]
MTTYAKVFLTNGKAYVIECQDRDEFLDLLEDSGLVEIEEDIIINPMQVCAVEFEEK